MKECNEKISKENEMILLLSDLTSLTGGYVSSFSDTNIYTITKEISNKNNTYINVFFEERIINILGSLPKRKQSILREICNKFEFKLM
jgi:hypothetical protein